MNASPPYRIPPGLARDPCLAFPADRQTSFAVAQLGQSLDGRIATPTGASRYINRPAALTHLHRLRARLDAVVVGVGTAIADDPQLTVRHVPGPSPARVVIDPRGRMPASLRLLEDDGARRIVIRGEDAADCAGAQTLRLPLRGGVFDPHEVRAALASLGLKQILVEGGSATVSAFLAAGAVDRLHVLVGPLILGSGFTGINLPPIAAVDEALAPHTDVYLLADGDVLFDCDLARRRGDGDGTPDNGER